MKFWQWVRNHAPRIVVSYEKQACCEIPKWYGVAYQDYYRAAVVMWWIPLNLVARFIHDTRRFLKAGCWNQWKKKSYLERLEQLEREHLDDQKHIQMLHQAITAKQFRDFKVAVAIAEAKEIGRAKRELGAGTIAEAINSGVRADLEERVASATDGPEKEALQEILQRFRVRPFVTVEPVNQEEKEETKP